MTVRTTTDTTRKIVNVSSKRQVTIPKQIYHQLGFSNEAEWVLRNGELILRPLRLTNDPDFSVQILEELTAKGLQGAELLAEFKRRQSQIRPAVQELMNEAKKAARGESEYATYADVFGTEDEE